MNQSGSSANSGFDQCSLRIARLKFPEELLGIARAFAQVAKNIFLAVMPKNRAAINQTEGHVIGQRFTSRTCAIRAEKMQMRPGPKIAVAVAAVVTLHAVAEGLAAKGLAVARDLAGEDSVGMRRAREADPAFAAEFGVKRRAIVQIPRDAPTIDGEAPATFVLRDAVFPGFKGKRTVTARAQTEISKAKSLNPRFRFSGTRKPRRPNLHGLAAGFFAAAVSARARE